MKAKAPKKRILFIVNPIAGVRSKVGIPDLIEQEIDKQQYDCHIAYTQFAGHAVFLTREAVEKQLYDVVVAVGGDGSVNEVASQLVDTPVALGIVPLGSGNGLARKLGIPMQQRAAIQTLNHCHTTPVDVGVINNRYFFSNAGIGYSAQVAARFAGRKNRGMSGYAFTIATGLSRYHPVSCQIACNNSNFEVHAFDITFNNSGQFGYGMGLTPNSNLSDGQMELSIVRHFPLYQIFWVVLLFLINRLYKSRYLKEIEMQQASLCCSTPLQAQIDGDPVFIDDRFEVQIKQLALKVVVPDKDR
ncbi:hypothetical protein C7N43_03210 [Sphingobacteriales bacterium UPWRP_1]|nr:hypothetical protein BVG80_08610 [Sphingobacteriales bacterium TSM_CSM]PSJ78488.1 hypothetical protein C7N43_03210 [Sphingobacteriales bacterium UPWRP_1]